MTAANSASSKQGQDYAAPSWLPPVPAIPVAAGVHMFMPTAAAAAQPQQPFSGFTYAKQSKAKKSPSLTIQPPAGPYVDRFRDAEAGEPDDETGPLSAGASASSNYAYWSRSSSNGGARTDQALAPPTAASTHYELPFHTRTSVDAGGLMTASVPAHDPHGHDPSSALYLHARQRRVSDASHVSTSSTTREHSPVAVLNAKMATTPHPVLSFEHLLHAETEGQGIRPHRYARESFTDDDPRVPMDPSHPQGGIGLGAGGGAQGGHGAPTGRGSYWGGGAANLATSSYPPPGPVSPRHTHTAQRGFIHIASSKDDALHVGRRSLPASRNESSASGNQSSSGGGSSSSSSGARGWGGGVTDSMPAFQSSLPLPNLVVVEPDERASAGQSQDLSSEQQLYLPPLTSVSLPTPTLTAAWHRGGQLWQSRSDTTDAVYANTFTDMVLDAPTSDPSFLQDLLAPTALDPNWPLGRGAQPGPEETDPVDRIRSERKLMVETAEAVDPDANVEIQYGQSADQWDPEAVPCLTSFEDPTFTSPPPRWTPGEAGGTGGGTQFFYGNGASFHDSPGCVLMASPIPQEPPHDAAEDILPTTSALRLATAALLSSYAGTRLGSTGMQLQLGQGVTAAEAAAGDPGTVALESVAGGYGRKFLGHPSLGLRVGLMATGSALFAGAKTILQREWKPEEGGVHMEVALAHDILRYLHPKQLSKLDGPLPWEVSEESFAGSAADVVAMCVGWARRHAGVLWCGALLAAAADEVAAGSLDMAEPNDLQESGLDGRSGIREVASEMLARHVTAVQRGVGAVLSATLTATSILGNNNAPHHHPHQHHHQLSTYSIAAPDFDALITAALTGPAEDLMDGSNQILESMAAVDEQADELVYNRERDVVVSDEYTTFTLEAFIADGALPATEDSPVEATELELSMLKAYVTEHNTPAETAALVADHSWHHGSSDEVGCTSASGSPRDAGQGETSLSSGDDGDDQQRSLPGSDLNMDCFSPHASAAHAKGTKQGEAGAGDHVAVNGIFFPPAFCESQEAEDQGDRGVFEAGYGEEGVLDQQLDAPQLVSDEVSFEGVACHVALDDVSWEAVECRTLPDDEPSDAALCGVAPDDVASGAVECVIAPDGEAMVCRTAPDEISSETVECCIAPDDMASEALECSAVPGDIMPEAVAAPMRPSGWDLEPSDLEGAADGWACDDLGLDDEEGVQGMNFTLDAPPQDMVAFVETGLAPDCPAVDHSAGLQSFDGKVVGVTEAPAPILHSDVGTIAAMELVEESFLPSVQEEAEHSSFLPFQAEEAVQGSLSPSELEETVQGSFSPSQPEEAVQGSFSPSQPEEAVEASVLPSKPAEETTEQAGVPGDGALGPAACDILEMCSYLEEYVGVMRGQEGEEALPLPVEVAEALVGLSHTIRSVIPGQSKQVEEQPSTSNNDGVHVHGADDVPHSMEDAPLELVEQIEELQEQLASLKSDYDDLLLCLGQETSKSAVLVAALQEAGIDPSPLTDKVEKEWSEM